MRNIAGVATMRGKEPLIGSNYEKALRLSHYLFFGCGQGNFRESIVDIKIFPWLE
jgi:hypothetical protein